MITHIVRFWVDIKVKGADSREVALEVARKHRIKVEETQDVEPYDVQVSGQVWEKEEEEEG